MTAEVKQFESNPPKFYKVELLVSERVLDDMLEVVKDYASTYTVINVETAQVKR